MKKILTLFLVQVLCMAFLCIPALAEETSQDPQLTDNANSWRYKDGQPFYDYGISVIADEPYHPNATLTGIDVSKHQGVIDWEKVKAAGIDFAIIRCGFGEDITDYDDVRWHYNASECERLGIPYGVYLYSYAFNEAEAESEADHVLRLIEGYNPSLPIYYDMEDNSTLPYDHAAMATAFCNKISAAGYPVGVYASLYWWKVYLDDPCFDQWHRWVAQWNTSCEYTGQYAMWQYSSTGSVDGISTNVDMNFLIGYPEDHGVVPGPQLTGSVSEDGLPKLTWEALSGASGYKVYRSTQRNSGYTAVDVSAAGYTDTAAAADTTYYYKVKAVYPNGSQSGSSNIVEITPILNTPQVYLTNSVDTGKPRLKWDAVYGADRYQIYRQKGTEKEYTLIATVENTYYADTLVSAGETCYYKVRAVQGDGDTGRSQFSTPQFVTCDLPRVNTRVSQNAADGAVTVSWSSVDGASKYSLYRASQWNGEYTLVASIEGTVYTDTSSDAETNSYYKVMAVHSNKEANSAYSQPASCIYNAPRITIKIINLTAVGRETFSWQQVNRATSYEIYCSSSKNGEYALLDITTSASYANTSAQTDKTYYYMIKAVYSPRAK